MLSAETIQRLQQILKQEYGADVDLKTVTEIAYDLVGYFDTLAHIYHEIKIDENSRHEESDA